MQTSIACLQADELKSFIAGEFSDQRVTEIETHLSTCETCRSTIDNTVGDSDWWQDLEYALGTTAANDFEHRESGYERLIEQLGPTDDPGMMGRIGSYEIVGILGQGGMGSVLKAFDAALNRYVAIKLLLPQLASSGAARARFRREGQAAAAVIDDHVLPIYAVDQWQGTPYLVMQYTRGISLQKRLNEQGPLGLREILRVGLHAARGLAAAHAQGLVHRDVKPSNILLDTTVERSMLMDFGLARAVDDATLTRSGVVAGTPQYMSPEQARGEAVDHRSDLFSLGSVLYTICTGHVPFRAENSIAVLRLITDKEPRDIREVSPDVPEWLCAIITKLMSKQAEDRYASATEVADTLEGCLAHVQEPTAQPLPAPVTKLVESVGADGTAGDDHRAAGFGGFRFPPIRKFLAAAAFAFLMLFAGVLIVLELNKGTLTIESDVDDVQVRITRAKKIVDELTVTKTGDSVNIAAGDYIVEIVGDSDGLTLQNGRVTLHRGETEVVRIVHRNGAGRHLPPAVNERAHETDAQHAARVNSDKIVVDLYCGEDVMPQMNTHGPNKDRHIKMSLALGELDGITTNLRTNGTGNEISKAIIRCPAGYEKNEAQLETVAAIKVILQTAKVSQIEVVIQNANNPNNGAVALQKPSNRLRPIDFVLGKSNLANGDQIEIQSVTTSGSGLEVGATVTVKGTYTLKSQATANLCFFSTQLVAAPLVLTPVQTSQSTKATNGQHAFSLSKVIKRIGSPHVSFYHPTTGEGIGGVYFSEKDKGGTKAKPTARNTDSSEGLAASFSAGGLSERLQGDWDVVQDIREDGALKRHTYTASVDDAHMKLLNDGMRVVAFDLTIGSGGPPQQIDMRLSHRDRQEWLKGASETDANLIYYGIIDSSGDTIRICNHGAPGNPRPTKFTDSAGYGIWNFSRPTEDQATNSQTTQPANRDAIAQPKGKQVGTVLGKPVFEGEFNENVDLKWNLRTFFIEPVVTHYLKEQGIDPEEDLKKRIPDDSTRTMAVMMVRGLVLQEHLYRKFGGRVVLDSFGPHAFDAYQTWLKERRKVGDFTVTAPDLTELVDEVCTKVPENIRWGSPESIESAFDPSLIDKFIDTQAEIPVGAHTNFNFPLVGDVLNKPIRMPRSFVNENNRELPKLLQSMFVPPLTKHYRKQHPELDPTEAEIAAWIVVRKQQLVLGRDHAKKKIAELERKLSQAEQGAGMRESWEFEKRVLETARQLSDDRGDETEKGLRYAAIYAIGWIKFQKHLYDTYGGGRILVRQQIIAFDAQRKWVEHREKLGEFQIPDPALRTKFYDNWTNGAAIHDDALTDDPERYKTALEPAWLSHGKAGTAVPEADGKVVPMEKQTGK